MIILDISNPLTLLLLVSASALLIFLSQEIKRSTINAVTLFVFLVLLVVHVTQVATLPEEFRYQLPVLSRCIVIDFGFILVNFFAYLWVDDIEARANGKKSIDNSLDWFWKKI